MNPPTALDGVLLHDPRRRGHVQKIDDGIGVRWKLAPGKPELI